MRSYSPFQHLAESLQQVCRDADRAERRRAKAERAKRTNLHAAINYMENIHTYQLMVNGKPEGEPVEMLGAEAKEQNRIFQEKFRAEINAAIDAGKPYGQTGAVSRHWKWIK